MNRLILAVLFVFTAVLPLLAFNVDPSSFTLDLKKGEKKQIVIRIKNVFDFPVVSSETASGVGITKIFPLKLKLNAGAFTYVNVDVKAPADAAGGIDNTITFYVSGTAKNDKFRKTVVLPVRMNIKPNDNKTIPPK